MQKFPEPGAEEKITSFFNEVANKVFTQLILQHPTPSVTPRDWIPHDKIIIENHRKPDLVMHAGPRCLSVTQMYR